MYQLEFKENRYSLQSLTVADHFSNNGSPLRYRHMPFPFGQVVREEQEREGDVTGGEFRSRASQKRSRQLTALMKYRLSTIGTRTPENCIEETTKGLDGTNNQTRKYLASFRFKVNLDRKRIPGRISRPLKTILAIIVR